MDASTIIATATATIAAIAAWFTFKRDYWEKQKVQREIFTDFNKRFDDMNEALGRIRQLPLEALNAPLPLTKSTDSQKTGAEFIQDYLNLCSEEFLWHKKDLVAEDVWQAWRAGIFYYLKTKPFQHYFKQELEFASSYYGLFADLDEENSEWRKPSFLT